jgi:hypothetical protein
MLTVALATRIEIACGQICPAVILLATGLLVARHNGQCREREWMNVEQPASAPQRG